MAKHFEIADTRFSYHRNIGRILAEAALDGFYIIRTRLPNPGMPRRWGVPIRAYRAWNALKGRPIYHHLTGRAPPRCFVGSLTT